MKFVRVSGRIGSISLCSSLISYFLSLIFYLISFCLPDWISFQAVPIKIGLWRLCDVQILGYDRCADWSERSYPTNVTNNAFTGPPDFIRTSQALEIVAFVFLFISLLLILFGLCQRAMGILFFASSISMFITVIFHSSSIGLFLGQGKSTYSGSLSFAWWLAVVSLILSIIASFSLLILSFYILPTGGSPSSAPMDFYPGGMSQEKIMPMDLPMVYPPSSSNLYTSDQLGKDYF